MDYATRMKLDEITDDEYDSVVKTDEEIEIIISGSRKKITVTKKGILIQPKHDGFMLDLRSERRKEKEEEDDKRFDKNIKQRIKRRKKKSNQKIIYKSKDGRTTRYAKTSTKKETFAQMNKRRNIEKKLERRRINARKSYHKRKAEKKREELLHQRALAIRRKKRKAKKRKR